VHLVALQQYTMATSFASIQNIYEEQTKNLPNMQKWYFGHSLWKVHVLPTKMFFDIVWSALGLTHQTLKCNVMKETAAWPVYVVAIFPCHSCTVWWQGNFMWSELQHIPNFLLCVIQKNWGVFYIHV